MYPGELFRSFLPLRNPIGFGAADFVVFAAAALLSAAILLRAAVRPWWNLLAKRAGLTMMVLVALAFILRIALLNTSPVPLPAGADDFSYVLLADTLAHFRLANPTHALHQFFEAVFVLQQPAYSSIYPAGQGLVLGLGRIITGSYWTGVLASCAAVPALTYWMLRAWIAPGWALAGGLLALLQLGPLSQWTNSYWGGALSACAGCLVFGSLPRLTESTRRLTAHAVLLGFGLGLQLLTRPFELIPLLAAAGLYLLLVNRQFPRWPKTLLVVMALSCAPAIALAFLQNKAVTGSWTTLPYSLSRYEYGVPTTFTFQPNPVPHRELTPEQDLDYRAQAAIHGSEPETAGRYLARFWFRLRYLRFFVSAPLYLAAPFVLVGLRERRWFWAAATVALFLAATNFYPYFFPHYIAAASCVLTLIAVKGLETLARWRPPSGMLAAQWLICLCLAHFFFWYAIHGAGTPALLAATEYEAWDFINHDDPEGRRAVADTLARSPGSQLVFVRYAPEHRFHEWIANAADIDRARLVWARDLGAAANERLLHYFPARHAWLLEPDARPPRLRQYSPDVNGFEPVQ